MKKEKSNKKKQKKQSSNKEQNNTHSTMNEPKKIFRSRDDKVIAGVCGGFAQYFNIDPVWVRLIALILLFADGIGFIAYIIAWVLIPEEPRRTTNNKKTVNETKDESFLDDIPKECKSGNAYVLLGMIFVVLGSMFLLRNLFDLYLMKYFWPLTLIILGIYFLGKRRGR